MIVDSKAILASFGTLRAKNAYPYSLMGKEKLSATSPIAERTVAKLSLSPKSIPATMEFILQPFAFPLFLPIAILLLTSHPQAAKATPYLTRSRPEKSQPVTIQSHLETALTLSIFV